MVPQSTLPVHPVTLETQFHDAHRARHLRPSQAFAGTPRSGWPVQPELPGLQLPVCPVSLPATPTSTLCRTSWLLTWLSKHQLSTLPTSEWLDANLKIVKSFNVTLWQFVSII